MWALAFTRDGGNEAEPSGSSIITCMVRREGRPPLLSLFQAAGPKRRMENKTMERSLVRERVLITRST